MSRETRLLVVTITLSVLVLVLLSRFRFPDRPPMAMLPPAPLERLAARATYDELAAIVAGLQRGISPSLVVLRLGARSEGTPRMLSDVLDSVAPDSGVLHVPALRISPTTAIAVISSDSRILGIVGQGTDDAPPRILAADPVRRLALIDVPPAEGGDLRPPSLSDLRTPTYVVVVEGTRGGLSFRPLFLGSSDRFEDPRWERPLMAVSSVPLTSAGALVFSTEGQFLGAAVVEGGALALAGARDIVASIERLSRGETMHPIDAGVSVQPLTAPLSAALGVPSGVVVAQTAEGSPADGVLQSADVIVSLNGQRVDAADDFLLQLSQSERGAPLTLGVVRRGQTLDLELKLPAASAPNPNLRAGMTLGPRRNGGSLVTDVAPGSAAEAAGLQVGDVILQAGDVALPSPAQVTKLSTTGDSARYLPITIERDGRRQVVALALAADAAR